MGGRHGGDAMPALTDGVPTGLSGQRLRL